MRFRNYFCAETLKHKNSSVRRLTILMPVICIVMSAVLTNRYFTVDSYNWWYVGLAPGFVALLCGIIIEKEKKLGNRAVWLLPCDMGRIWDAKVLYGIWMSGAATVLLSCVTVVVAFFLETLLDFTFVIRPSIPAQIAAGFLIWLSFCWQVPWCLFLAQTVGRIPMLLISFVGYSLMAVIMALSPFYMFFPGALAARMMCVVLGVLPNGLPAEAGAMTYTPELVELSSIPIGIAASVIWFVLLWGLTRTWYKRRVERV